MKYAIVLVLTYIVAMFVLLTNAAPNVAAQMAPPALKASAIVRLHEPKTGRFFCSGVVVEEHRVLTAAHCVIDIPPGDKVSVRDLNGHVMGVLATVEGLSERADYAVLRGNFSKFYHMVAETSPLGILNNISNNKRKIIACGFPWSGDLFCTPVTDRIQMNFSIAAQGFLYPGMSGGPVIDVATGHVIGVNSAVNGPMIILAPIIEIYRNIQKP